jgi:copper homeostasis protein CutC
VFYMIVSEILSMQEAGLRTVDVGIHVDDGGVATKISNRINGSLASIELTWSKAFQGMIDHMCFHM